MADRPRIRDRIFTALTSLATPTPAAPPLPPRAPVVSRVDAARQQIVRRLDSLRNVVTGFGDDKITAGRPDLFRRPLTFQELTALWRFNGYARRFVESVPHDATRKGWDLLDAEGVVMPEAIEENKRLYVESTIHEGDSWGRLYGGAWVLMVTEDDIPTEFLSRPAQWMSQPLDLNRIRTVQNLVVLDWSEVQPATFETDLRNANFRRPRTYWVNPNAGGAVGALPAGSIVHASRMLYFPGTLLPPQIRYINNGVDDSILESVWDQIRNKTSMDHSLAVVAAELRVTALKMRELKGSSVSDEAEYFETRMRQLATHKSILNMILLGDDEEYTHHTGTVTGMGELDDTGKKALQAVTGMTGVDLFGETPGGLNSDGQSHRELKNKVVAAYQTTKYTKPLTHLYQVLMAAKAGPWKGQEPEGWELSFRPLDELSEQDTAELRKTTAETDQIYIESGVLDPADVRKGRFGPNGWQQDLPAAEEEPETNVSASAALEELERLRSGRQPAPPELGEERGDSHDVGIWIGIPLPAEALTSHNSARLEAATIAGVTLDELDTRGQDPHMTVLWLGRFPRDQVDAKVAQAADLLDHLLDEHRPIGVKGWGLGAFTPSPASDGDTPMIVHVESGAVWSLHQALIAKLLTEEERLDRHWFQPHVTLGYFSGDLPEDSWQKLMGAVSGKSSWVGTQVQLRAGNVTERVWQLTDPE